MALADAHAALASELRGVGFDSHFVADPYAALVELTTATRRVDAVVLSLSALYAGETVLIGAIRRQFEGVDVIVADVDGRAGALAEAVRLGANALLLAGQLHRLSPPAARPDTAPGDTAAPREPRDGGELAPNGILTQAELRALLQDA